MMLRAGFTHGMSTLYISIFNVFIIAIAFLLDGLGIFWLSIVLLAICILASRVLHTAVWKREQGLAQEAKAG